MKTIVCDISHCYGCRICELTCSWHHNRVFAPALSDIKVSKNNRTGAIEWAVDNSTCDLCNSEEEPLCIKYCAYKALALKEVRL